MSKHLLISVLSLVLTASIGCEGRFRKPPQAKTMEVPEGEDPILLRPQIVRVEKVEIRDGAKFVNVGNRNGTYVLACNQDQKSCVTPISGVDYFLFTKDTRWKFMGATEFATLKFLQSWEGEYPSQENVALVPVVQRKPKQWEITGEYGIYWMASWQAKTPTL